MTRRPVLRAVALAAAGTLVLAACGDDDPDDAIRDGGGAGQAPAVVEVAVPGGPDGEFTYATDLTTVAAGAVEVRLTNDGELEHQAAIFRFREGEDIGTFTAAAATGGPNAVAPGEVEASTQVLEPGEYALLCLIPDAAGVPHVAQGMVRPFTVTGPAEAADAATLPEPDVEIDLIDLAFSTTDELTAGATVRATNQGEQIHEIVAYRLDEGQTVADVVEGVVAGAAPANPAGGIGLVHPGRAAQFRLPEEPGDYVFLCFVPDATTEGGPPHLAVGMATQVRIG